MPQPGSAPLLSLQRWLLAGLATLGILDASYVLVTHAMGQSLACPQTAIINCEEVVNSQYSVVMGMPVAFWGLLAYLSVVGLALWPILGARVATSTDPNPDKPDGNLFLLRGLTTVMATISCYLVYLMVAVIHGVCLYCIGSFLVSLSLFGLANFWPAVAKVNGRIVIGGLLVGFLALAAFGAPASNQASPPMAPGGFPPPQGGNVIPQNGLVPLSEPVYPIPTTSGPAEMALARWLAENGAKMYGGYRCPHCFREKELFGRQAFQLIDYVECDPSTSSARVALCKAANIREYPTWEIGGKFYPGEANLEVLADRSNYPGSRAFARHILR